MLTVQVLTLHFEFPSTYVDDAEQELQNYVEKCPTQIFKPEAICRWCPYQMILARCQP